jgi:hypothetical protein
MRWLACLVRVPLLCLLLCMFASFLVLSCWCFLSFGEICLEFVLATPCLASLLPLTSQGSLVLLPSLHIGATFCALLLTTGTGKSLRRFVLGSADERAALLSVAW